MFQTYKELKIRSVGHNSSCAIFAKRIPHPKTSLSLMHTLNTGGLPGWDQLLLPSLYAASHFSCFNTASTQARLIVRAHKTSKTFNPLHHKFQCCQIAREFQAQKKRKYRIFGCFLGLDFCCSLIKGQDDEEGNARNIR